MWKKTLIPRVFSRVSAKKSHISSLFCACPLAFPLALGYSAERPEFFVVFRILREESRGWPRSPDRGAFKKSGG
jgi:hypothetical protein